MKERHTIACAAYLLLFKEERVFLIRRFNTGYEDGNYSVPAGHVENGEHISDTLIREAEEEIGISIQKQDIVLAHVMHRTSTELNDERVDFFFTCKQWNGIPAHQEFEKCDKSGWFDIKAPPSNIIPYIRMAIENVLNGVPYSELG
jgi:8-oxo-dGTP diphosphatase